MVYEPIAPVRPRGAGGTLGVVLPALARLRAVPQTPDHAWLCRARSRATFRRLACAELQQQLPALTRGEGVLECVFDRYQPVSGAIPRRPRFDNNPLNRKEYLLRVARRLAGR